MSVQPLPQAVRPYDRVDEIRRDIRSLVTRTEELGLVYDGNPVRLVHAVDWVLELLDVIADQRAQLLQLADEQWQEAYQLYLMSPDWQAVKEAALRQAGFRCQLCGETKHLQVHHRDYLRVFHETPADLSVLCRRCHANHHRRTA